ncbi:hypothetical protein M153_110001641 [Pseudoloma neurophilia]|uniref:Uncharacterized protein n=1 Tax=Pseudoloma neurophilia TaxID=146866 RepID=A0A0R0M1K9_9MICR|nr:hypothetical protein M153_110001641 [Pseudoloma neurophilia]
MMKKLSDFTTTELLLIAYGVDKRDSNRKILEDLKKEAENQNYTSHIDFVNDLRFQRLIDVYKQKKEEQRKLIEEKHRLEENYHQKVEFEQKKLDEIGVKESEVINLNKIFDSGSDIPNFDVEEPINQQIDQPNPKMSPKKSIYDIPADESVLKIEGKQVNDQIDPFRTHMTSLFSIKRSFERYSRKRPIRPEKQPNNNFKLQIKQDNHFSNIQVIPHNQNKQSKIFYKQMSDDEREIDDFLDKLQERNNEKIKSKNVTRNVEYSESNGSNVFNFIIEKVTNRKGIRDKNLWPSEYAVIIENIKADFELDFEFKNDLTLLHACLPVLMKLQQFIFEKTNLEQAKFFKRLIISFYDFYRK